HLEDYIVVTDKQAFEAQRFLLERSKVLTELAASCTLSAFEKPAAGFGPEDHVVLLLCGGNDSLENMRGYAEKFNG
ncbi:MAG: threonine/serine dehydratase, partial [Chloroflexota bacterium]